MLRGGSALVTGASRGIGRAVATRLHREGMNVTVVARSVDRLHELRRELGARVLVQQADVTDVAGVRQAVAAAEEAFGAVDLLVNNAGLTESGDRPLWEADADDWWQTVTTNLRGPMLVAQAVLTGMVARNRGRIININSSRSVRTLPTQTAYSASKAALAQLTKSLAAGLAGSGVCVFDYSPGRVDTDLTRSLGYRPAPHSSFWTPMETAVDGVVTIAEGGLDRLSGRFLHAHDDLPNLAARSDDVVRHGGRTLTISEAYSGDPFLHRIAAR